MVWPGRALPPPTMKFRTFSRSALPLLLTLVSLAASSEKAQAVTMFIDFGDTATTTSGGNSWNNVTSAIGTVPGSGIGNLTTSTGTASGIALTIVARFGGANTNGTTAAGSGYPNPSATGDSLYGNTEEFSGRSNIFPVFTLSNLTLGQTYDFNFFASRTGASDNRETTYTIEGATTSSVSLNAANNVSNTVGQTGVLPDASGEITIRITAGPNNTNSSHFTYLNVLEVNTVPEPASAAVLCLGGLLMLRRRR